MPKVWSEYLFHRSLGAVGPPRGWSPGQCLAQLHQSWSGPSTIEETRQATTSYRGLALEPCLAGGIYNLDYNHDGCEFLKEYVRVWVVIFGMITVLGRWWWRLVSKEIFSSVIPVCSGW